MLEFEGGLPRYPFNGGTESSECLQWQTTSDTLFTLSKFGDASGSSMLAIETHRSEYISALDVPNLEHLNINGCREVDDEGLSMLL